MDERHILADVYINYIIEMGSTSLWKDNSATGITCSVII